MAVAVAAAAAAIFWLVEENVLLISGKNSLPQTRFQTQQASLENDDM